MSRKLPQVSSMSCLRSFCFFHLKGFEGVHKCYLDETLHTIIDRLTDAGVRQSLLMAGYFLISYNSFVLMFISFARFIVWLLLIKTIVALECCHFQISSSFWCYALWVSGLFVCLVSFLCSSRGLKSKIHEALA